MPLAAYAGIRATFDADPSQVGINGLIIRQMQVLLALAEFGSDEVVRTMISSSYAASSPACIDISRFLTRISARHSRATCRLPMKDGRITVET